MFGEAGAVTHACDFCRWIQWSTSLDERVAAEQPGPTCELAYLEMIVGLSPAAPPQLACCQDCA